MINTSFLNIVFPQPFYIQVQKYIVFNYTPTRREGAILQSPCPSVRLSIRSHFRNRYLSFYWKKWLHIYFLFTVRLTNERVGVFLAWHSVKHLVVSKPLLLKGHSDKTNQISAFLIRNMHCSVTLDIIIIMISSVTELMLIYTFQKSKNLAIKELL